MHQKLLLRLVILTALVLGGVTILVKTGYAQIHYVLPSDNAGFTLHGAVQNWSLTSGEGYCGHIQAGCSPNSMRSTPAVYTGFDPCAYEESAQWNYGSSFSTVNAAHGVFIPRVNATSTKAPYILYYNNNLSSFQYTINQNAYFDVWRLTNGGGQFYAIRRNFVYDNSCEQNKLIAADETEVIH